jgi:hypothetical protein
LDPFYKLTDIKVFGMDTFEGSDMAAEDVVNPFTGPGFFETDNIFGLLYNTYNVFFTFLVGADIT